MLSEQYPLNTTHLTLSLFIIYLGFYLKNNNLCTYKSIFIFYKVYKNTFGIIFTKKDKVIAKKTIINGGLVWKKKERI